MSFAGVEPSDPGQTSGFDYSDIGASQRSGAVQLPFMESLADTASNAFMSGVRGVGDYITMDNARQLAIRDRQFNVDPTQDPGGALIDPKEWQAKYPDLGLNFTPDMGQAQAQLLVNHRQDELRRQYVLDHSPNTFMAKTARGLTDFAVSALDPINIAAAFVPGLGETRAGLLAARYGKTVGRIAEGAAAGATGMAALQPLQYAEAKAYQDQYGPMDAFLNVAFGAALGGGLHAGFGKLSDILDRARPETQEAALKASVGQMAEGRAVDVEPVLATDPALVEGKIGTAEEPGPLNSFPVINDQDIRLAGQQRQLETDVASHETALANLNRDAVPSFTTAKGSTYEVHSDGTTTRNKAARPDPGHEGQSGPQPQSQSTFYVTKEHADELGLFQAQGVGARMAVVERPDGTAGVKYLDGKDAGKFEGRTVAKVSKQPSPGLIPVETWKDGTRVHFGNEITKVESRPRPAENPGAVKKLSDLQDVESKMLAEDLTPEGRRALGQRRDEILANTNPETLKAEAQPTFDRQALAEQDRGLRAQRDNAASMLEEIKSQRRQLQVLNALGPYARAQIDRARQGSMDFAAGREPSPVAARPEVQAHADATLKMGDDPATELADAQARIQAYKAQGIISDEEHTAFSDAAKADAEAFDTRSKAADAAARCLFLHP